MSRMMWVSMAIGGLLVLGCDSPSVSNQAKSATSQCTGLRALNADHLAIVGTAKPGKAESAFQVVERLSISSGGCLVRFYVHGASDQVINVDSAPQTSKQEVSAFVDGMKASGEFVSVVTK